MSSLQVALDELLPVKTAVRSLSWRIAELDEGEKPHYIITRRNKPTAVLLTVSRYEELLAAEQRSSNGKGS